MSDEDQVMCKLFGPHLAIPHEIKKKNHYMHSDFLYILVER